MRVSRLRAALAGALAVLLGPLSSPSAGTITRAALEAALEQRLETSKRDERALWAVMQTIYQARAFEAIWHGDSARESRAAEMIARLEHAESDGLDPQDYSIPPTEPHHAAGIGNELSLTRSAIQMARHIRAGRIEPGRMADDMDALPPVVDALAIATALAEAPQPAELLNEGAPPHKAYRLLRSRLGLLRSLRDLGGWPTLPATDKLEIGVRDEAVETLRRRLALIDSFDLLDDPDPELFDARVHAAVIAAQRRHGLKPDGVVGPRTRAALNVGIDERIRQIEANLERWRWMPDDLGDRHLMVNTADFRLDLVENGAVRFSTRVIVGTPRHRTPLFSHDMTHIVLNPSWYVPDSIATEELLPKIQADPTYLETHNYVVTDRKGERVDPMSVPWSTLSLSHFPYRLRQRPGDGNALGRIKFMFPNRFSVYLHDTPAKNLFNYISRTFSHGCIRVQYPMELGAQILGWQAFDRTRIEEIIGAGRTRTIMLATALPVHVAYFTAWVDEDGALHFRDDIYDRDATLIAALHR